MRKGTFTFVSLLVLLTLVLAACSTPTPETIVVTSPPEQVEVTVPPEQVEVTVEVPVEVTSPIQPTDEPIAGRVQVEWYIGLGTGAQPQQIPLERDWVAAFNES